ncbi:MAG: hypothetical protein LBD45_01510, partial [Bacteroidales bacterium]|nr:hypothetical protein [Bacteroidales bacterium]
MKFLPIFFMFLLMLGMHYYVIFRLWQMIPAVTVRVVMLVVTVSAVVSIVLSITAGEAFPSPVTGVMYRMGTAWFFIFLYLLIIFLLLDIVRITHLLPMEKVLHGNWISLSVVCGFIAVVMSYGFFTYQHKEQVELDLPVDNIAFPLKILAISDLHLGYNIGKDEF